MGVQISAPDARLMNQERILTWGTFLLSLAAAGLGVWLVAQQIRAFDAYPPDFDEAVHALPALQLANAVQRGDPAAFWRHSLLQERLAAYPFFHSWLTFPAWLVKPRLFTLRSMSLLFLAGAAGLAFWIGRDLASGNLFAWLAGGVSAGLLLTALPLWVYGSVAYLEGAGLLVVMLALWCYGRSFTPWKRPSAERKWLTAASLAVAAAFFTKYNFGVFLAAGLALNELMILLASGAQRETGQKRLTFAQWPALILNSRLFYLAAPAALLILLWFSNVDRLLNFFSYSQAQQGDLSMRRLESWLYYPASLSRQYLNGAPVWLLVGGGLAYAVLHWRQPAQRALLLYVAVSALMLVAVPQKTPRFLYTVAPALFPLAGSWAATAVSWLSERFSRCGRRPAWSRGLAWLVVACFLAWQAGAIYQRYAFFPAALEIAYDSNPETAGAYAFVAAHTLAQGERLHVVNAWHQFNPYALQWSYYAAQGYPPVEIDYWQVTSDLAPEPTETNLALWVGALRRQGVTMLLTIDGSPAGNYTGWQAVEPLLAQGVLEPVTRSPVYTLNNWSNDYREAVLASAFPDVGASQAARARSRGEFQIQLHLYRLRP
jgi:hypothetical protein